MEQYKINSDSREPFGRRPTVAPAACAPQGFANLLPTLKLGVG